MSTAAQLAANIANAQASTGPRSEAGRATSSRNSTKHGLFATHDYIRPDEEPFYEELNEKLRQDLAPASTLEHNLVDEIRRAMWRLRRCGQVEEGFLDATPVHDPMQNATTAPLQNSVDRARAQSHRLLHKCTAELRKLQTERQFRNDLLEVGADISGLGLCDLRSVNKGIDQRVAASLRQHKLDEINHLNLLFEDTRLKVAAMPLPPTPAPSAETPFAGRTQSQPTGTARNAPCPCKSGEKYKRCCGKNAPAILHAA
jgi:SEC-C motif